MSGSEALGQEEQAVTPLSLRAGWLGALVSCALCGCPDPFGGQSPPDAAAPADAAWIESTDAARPDASVADATEPPDAGQPPDAAARLPLQVTSAPLIPAKVGVALAVQLTASGGMPPYYWSVAPGSLLPPGFCLSSDGIFGGTPQDGERVTFDLVVADLQATTATATFELAVLAPPTNDTCAAAIPLSLVFGKALAYGTLVDAHADGVSNACLLSPEQSDVFFTLDLAERSQVTVEVTAGFAAAIYPGGCSSAPLGCATSIKEILPPGRIVIAVVAMETASTEFNLEITVKPPAGDSCADAIPFDLSSGAATITGTFYLANDDIDSCTSGPDRVYSFTVSTMTDLVARASPGRPGVWLELLSEDCSTRIDCFATSWVEQQLHVRDLAPGNYYLVVKEQAYSVTYGFSVDVSLTSGPFPVNDSCATATEVTLVDDEAEIDGTLVGATLDPGPGATCGSAPHDVFYAIDLVKPSVLEFASAPYGTDLEILSGQCGQLASLECGWASCGTVLAAGRYYLRVVGVQDPFHLSVTRRDAMPAPNASCAAPASTVFDSSGQASIDGILGSGGVEVLLPTACAPYSKPKSLLFRLELTDRSDLKFRYLMDPTQSIHLSVGVMAGDCGTGTLIGCRNGMRYQELRLWSLPAGTYHVVVEDGSDRTDLCWGKFTLALTAVPSPPSPPNDDCTGAIAYSFPGPGSAVMIVGTTKGAADDFSHPQGPITFDGPDVVYALTLQTAAKIRVTSPSDFEGVYYLTDACGGTSAEGHGSGVWGFTTDVLAPGAYHLVVDTADDHDKADASDFVIIVDTL